MDTLSYDEVLRFRKSAAKYVGDNALTMHRMRGFNQTVGLVFGWYNNFDLLVSTPNGRRETHAMATEFQMHPAGLSRLATHSMGSVLSHSLDSLPNSANLLAIAGLFHFSTILDLRK